jgi:putative lysine transport system substrate-binding protein
MQRPWISDWPGLVHPQLATIWYDSMLPQIPDADIRHGTAKTVHAHALEPHGGFCLHRHAHGTGRPAAMTTWCCWTLRFRDDFEVSDEEVNIGISMRKGNTVLFDAVNAVLEPMTADDFNAVMDQAIAVQPMNG